MDTLNEIRLSFKNSKKLSYPKIDSPENTAKLLFNTWKKDEIGLFETFKVIYLNNSNCVKGIVEHSKGGITGTVVDIRLIMATALKSLSVGMILAHNHPSGTLKPSNADIQLTQKIKTAAGYFDISLLDHIILNPDGDYSSFSNDGLL